MQVSCFPEQAVIKSYYDGPIPVNLSSSLLNVRDRDSNNVGYVMGRVEHMNNVGQQPPVQKMAGSVSTRTAPQGTMGAYSESNLLALGTQQLRYSPQHHMQHKNAFLYGNMGKHFILSQYKLFW